MKTAQKFLGLSLGLLLLVLNVPDVRAAQVQNLNILLDDTRPTTSSNYVFQWTTGSTATLREIRYEFCDAPSGTCTPPTGLVTTSAVKGTLTGPTSAEWSLNVATANKPKLQHVASGESITQNTIMSTQITTITNHSISACDAEASSDTCFVWLTTYSDLGTTKIDEGVASYTVVAAVTVQARVDPLFTFIVGAVAADQVNNQITTSVASTYNSLPFSNLTANAPKYAAHSLTVTTNTEAGYTIDQYLISQMTGVYSGNNIDPFIATWGTPTTWTQPTGSTPNTDTAWIGANTTDTDVAGWGSPNQKFGPVTNASNTVMSATGSDDGSTPVYVTYGIEANVFQPADTYTGTLIYIALPKY